MISSNPLNKIIALYDFSECAHNALIYATKMAMEAKASLYVLHTFTPRSARLLSSDAESDLIAEKDLLMKELRALVDPLSTSYKMDIQLFVKNGDLASELNKLCDRTAADLVIMGTYSQNPVKRFVLGSSTIEVLEKVSTPVCVIPPHCHYEGINRVEFTTNYHTGSIASIHQARELLSVFNPDFSLLHFTTPDEKDSQREHFESLMQKDKRLNNIPIKLVDAQTLLLGLWRYSRAEDIDMIIMANKRRKGLAKIFNTSAEEEAIYTRVPLLVIPRSSVNIDIALSETEIP